MKGITVLKLKATPRLKSFVVITVMMAAAWATFPSLDARQVPQAPGGFVEPATSTAYRTPPTPAQIAAFLPASRGRFYFPAPYNTEAYRLTVPADCGGGDCVEHTGYSDWRNINNHAGRPELRVFLSLAGVTSYAGPTLFTINKNTGSVTNNGPIFPSSSEFSYSRAEGWYWSGTNPDVIYAHAQSRLVRHNVATGQQQVVLDLNTRPAGFFPEGTRWRVWSPHSSDNDDVHVGTVKIDGEPYTDLGCYVYEQSRNRWSFYQTQVDCFVDKSGRYVMLYDNVDGRNGVDAVSIDLETGVRSAPLLDENGAPGHMDYGHGYLIGEDNWNGSAQALRLWDLTQPWTAPGQGRVMHSMTRWGNSYVQPAWGGALPRSVKPIDQQYMCSQATFEQTPNPPAPREREVVCFRLDGSQQMLVVAPTLVDMQASGGGIQYNKAAKGNMDPSGEYYVWTANMGGNRLEAFLVRVPYHLLTGGTNPGDTTAPTVAMSAPTAGATLTGSATVSATASDNVGIVGVQFRLDGSPIGLEDITAPYSISWDSTGASNGSHTLTAVARDAAGNTSISTAVNVTVSNTDTTAPTIALTAPTAGGTVSGSVAVSATASDNVGVAAVQFLLNGSNLGAEDPTAPFSVTWNTTGVTNGSYTLSARVRDAAGNTANAAARTVTVANAVSDTQPPTAPTGLTATAVSSNQINLSWTASTDNTGVTGYRISRGGTVIGTSTTTTYSSTGLTPSTPYSFTVQAYDGAGNNSAQSASASATTQAAPPASANLVGAFAFNEGSGTVASDASANHNSANLNNASWAAGQLGGSMSLSGGGFADAPDTDALTPGLNATFEAWVYLNSAPTEHASVLNKWSQSVDDEYLFAINPNRNIYFAWKTSAADVWGTPAFNDAASSGQVPLNAWTHVAIVRNAETLSFYINGTLSSSLAAMDANPFRNGINSLRIGGQSRGNNRFLDGRVDEVRVYSRSLTLSEIQSDMTTPIAGSNDTTAPSVSVSAPLNNAVVSGTINVTATAADNVAVAGVQFQVDGVNQGAEDTSAPYALSWNTASAGNGTHTLRAVARDAAGNVTTSSTVSVSVQNADTTAPTVAITAPAAGSTVNGTVSVTATATDTVGVVGVQFQVDGVNQGAEDTTAPYAFSWSTAAVTNGAHTLRAVARDAAGNTATSATVSVTVQNADTTAPTVALTAPAAGSSVSGTVTVTATAADAVGVTSVQFQLDGVNMGAADTASPFSYSWNTAGANNGSHQLRAIARDAAGNATTSAAVSVTVANADVTVPTVSVTVPSAGATVSGNVTLTASAADNVGVAGVRFQVDGVNVGAEDTSSPYSVAWDTTTATNGAHAIRAIARDAAGNTATSAVVNVTVQNVVTPPGGGAEAVSWTNMYNATATNGTIRKTGGCDGCADSAGLSAQRIQDGDAYVELRVNIQPQVRYFGFSGGNTGTSQFELRQAFRLAGNTVEVREYDVVRASTTVVEGDVLRIEIFNNQMRYMKNNVQIFRSVSRPVFPMAVDVALLGAGAELQNVVMSFVRYGAASLVAGPTTNSGPIVGTSNATSTETQIATLLAQANRRPLAAPVRREQ